MAKRLSAVAMAALINTVELLLRVGVDLGRDTVIRDCRARLRHHLWMAEEDAPRVAMVGGRAAEAGAAPPAQGRGGAAETGLQSGSANESDCSMA